MIELLLTQVNYKVEEDSSGTERPVMHLFGRTADNEVEQVRVLGHQPYFYAALDSIERDPRDEHDEVTGVKPGYESIRGKDLTKISTQLPKHVGQIRDDYEHFEADVLFPNRLMIDLGIGAGIRVPEKRIRGGAIEVDIDDVETCDPPMEADMRVHHLDIEVDDRSGFPQDGEEPIICFTTFDDYDQHYIVWWYKEDTKQNLEEDTEIGDHVDESVELRQFRSEEKMLESYLRYIENTDPDLMVGWNFEDFDAPYLIDRLDELDDDTDRDLDSDRLSRINEVWHSGNNWGGPNVKGRVIFDLLQAYKFTQFTEKESYRLEAIAQQEVGKGKEVYTGDIGDLWTDDPDKLLEYSFKDVELTVEIDRTTGTIDFIDSLRRFVGCRFEEATTANEVCDMYVLHKTYGRFVLPSQRVEDYEDYSGGAVFDPIEGVRENVVVTDLKSLYPMCMVTMNLSPETHVPDPEAYDGETYVSPNGLHFQKEPDGVVREIVDELLGEREELKGLRNDQDPDSKEYKKYDRQQASVKVVMNSLYGVLGWEKFRLYDADMGAAVTATGRGVIEFSEEVVNELGYEVTYGDTDSVMMELGEGIRNEVDEIVLPDEVLENVGAETQDEARSAIREKHPDMTEEEFEDFLASMMIGFRFERQINERYDEYAEKLNADEHRFQMEFEKLYRRYFQAGKKKRYAGHIVWKEFAHVDKTDIVGFETERSDVSAYATKVMEETIDMIVRGDEDDVKEFVHEKAQEILDGNVSLDDIGTPAGLGKRLDDYDNPGIRVKAALWANLMLGKNFQRGDKPKHVYLDRVEEQFYHKLERRREWELKRNDLYNEFKRRAAAPGNKKTNDKCAIAFEVEQELPEEFHVDWEKELSQTLEGPISRIIEPLGITWDEAVSGQTQTGLGQWG